MGFTNRIPAMQACVLPSIGQHAPIPNADTPISASVAMALDTGLQRAKPGKATHPPPVSNPHTTHTRQPACRFGNLCVCCLACTPVKISPLLALLEQYPPRAQAEKLQTGFTQGFRLGFIGPRIGRDAPNLQSVRQRTQMALEKLDKEVSLGRMAGPFTTPPFENLCISPIGLVPKAEAGQFRLIHHLSYPESESVNDGIDKSQCSVKYSTFDDALHLVMRAGKGSLLATADIKSAFCLLPINPSDFCLLGIKVQGRIYVDKALPMGASCAPAFFEAFSTFLEWATIRRSGLRGICHYADDFLFVGGSEATSPSSCKALLQSFKDTCQLLGVPLAEEKTVEPTSRLSFLGLDIDSAALSVFVPHDKLSKIQGKIQEALSSDKITLRALQSLIGSLAFICRAVAPGRAFLRLIDLTRGTKKAWHLIRLSSGAKEDLRTWHFFLRNFNGKTIIPDQFWVLDSDVQLFTDASGGSGFGGYFNGQWFAAPWPPDVKAAGHSIAGWNFCQW